QHGRLIEESWNEVSETAHWRGRDGDQPFFHIFNDMTSHQSRTMVWPYEQFEYEVASKLSPEQIHDPGDTPVPPYYPDTPVIRRTVARFYDCVTAMDKNVGNLLDQLEEDGLAENTIVFFYSDHGSGMPRHKRNLQDTGMHVPLIIRFPEKWKHLAPAEAGETIDRLVSFVDFAPTILSLLEIEIPAHMKGVPFLGKAAGEPKSYVFGARDRVDEAFDLSRSVRDKKWLYIRNFMPHLSYNQPCAWPGQGEIRKEIARLAEAGSLRPGPARDYAGPTKAVEELYDTTVDPLCLNNLADSEEHAAELERLRSEQLYWSLETRDVGFIAESIAWRMSKDGPLLDLEDPDLLSQVREAAEIAGGGIGRKEDALAALQSEVGAVRYWGVVALRALGRHALDTANQLGAALSDSEPAVRIEAAGALVELGNVQIGLTILAEEVLSEDLVSALHACRTIELLGEQAAALKPEIQMVSEKCKEGMGQATDPLIPGKTDEFMFLGFSADAFLAKIDQ
ncbi:MAG: sulfatase-like hydrolase/transferase, partial [Verrucomicrobiota bacterium]